MRKRIILGVLILLAPVVAWIFGVIRLGRVGEILVGISVLYIVVGLLSRSGRSYPGGDASFPPIDKAESNDPDWLKRIVKHTNNQSALSFQTLVLGLTALIVGIVLIWFFKGNWYQ